MMTLTLVLVSVGLLAASSSTKADDTVKGSPDTDLSKAAAAAPSTVTDPPENSKMLGLNIVAKSQQKGGGGAAKKDSGRRKWRNKMKAFVAPRAHQRCTSWSPVLEVKVNETALAMQVDYCSSPASPKTMVCVTRMNMTSDFQCAHLEQGTCKIWFENLLQGHAYEVLVKPSCRCENRRLDPCAVTTFTGGPYLIPPDTAAMPIWKPPQRARMKAAIVVTIASSAGALVAILSFAIVILCRRKRKSRSRSQQPHDMSRSPEDTPMFALPSTGYPPPAFSPNPGENEATIRPLLPIGYPPPESSPNPQSETFPKTRYYEDWDCVSRFTEAGSDNLRDHEKLVKTPCVGRDYETACKRPYDFDDEEDDGDRNSCVTVTLSYFQREAARKKLELRTSGRASRDRQDGAGTYMPRVTNGVDCGRCEVTDLPQEETVVNGRHLGDCNCRPRCSGAVPKRASNDGTALHERIPTTSGAADPTGTLHSDSDGTHERASNANATKSKRSLESTGFVIGGASAISSAAAERPPSDCSVEYDASTAPFNPSNQTRPIPDGASDSSDTQPKTTLGGDHDGSGTIFSVTSERTAVFADTSPDDYARERPMNFAGALPNNSNSSPNFTGASEGRSPTCTDAEAGRSLGFVGAGPERSTGFVIRGSDSASAERERVSNNANGLPRVPNDASGLPWVSNNANGLPRVRPVPLRPRVAPTRENMIKIPEHLLKDF